MGQQNSKFKTYYKGHDDDDDSEEAYIGQFGILGPYPGDAFDSYPDDELDSGDDSSDASGASRHAVVDELRHGVPSGPA